MELRHQSVLIVEDEPLIAAFLADIIAETGADIVGPANSTRTAIYLINKYNISSAILDINIRVGEVTPVAADLVARSIQFIIHTGGILPSRLRLQLGQVPVVTKPARPKQIITNLVQNIQAHASHSVRCDNGHQSLGRVLLIEDDYNSALILEAHVRALGCTSVEQADTEIGAVRAANRRRPDLMLVDLHLREGTGLAAAQAINLAACIPHVFVTAFPERACGIDRALVVRKPYSAATLTAAIAHAQLNCSA